MQVKVLEREGECIVEGVDITDRLDEILDLVAACFEHDSACLLIESRNLPPAFFDLRSGFAGELVQKLQNYHIRLAGVFPSEDAYDERFREFLLEARRGQSFRVFEVRGDAETWLLGESLA
jgi:PadR family transcriptional regulator AphA